LNLTSTWDFTTRKPTHITSSLPHIFNLYTTCLFWWRGTLIYDDCWVDCQVGNCFVSLSLSCNFLCPNGLYFTESYDFRKSCRRCIHHRNYFHK
jgi:hypothetical protein